VEAFGDEEFAGEASHDVLVNGNTQALSGGHHRLREPDEFAHGARGDGTHQPAQRATRQDMTPASEQGEAHVSERVEVEDALDAQQGLEEERQDEAAPWCAPTAPKQEAATP
jgi:hypothetical protein